jgi:hypothetical protein
MWSRQVALRLCIIRRLDIEISHPLVVARNAAGLWRFNEAGLKEFEYNQTALIGFR